jgi:hypothetical protein
MSWQEMASSAMASGGGGGGGGANYTRYIDQTRQQRAARTADRERAAADYRRNIGMVEEAEAEAAADQAPIREAEAVAAAKGANLAAQLSGESPQAAAPTFYERGVTPTARGQAALLQNLQAAKAAEAQAYAESPKAQPQDRVVSEATDEIKRQNLEAL